MVEFKEFPKIPRWNRDVIITEKIDGTNACVGVTEDGQVFAQSRNRVLTEIGKNDNYGFNQWVIKHAEELRALGPGYHYGEWWGVGIARNYGLSERRFSLFPTRDRGPLPACCLSVPQLYVGAREGIGTVLEDLRENGSKAEPGFMAPEGIIVYHTASRQVYKILLENDDMPKGLK